MTTKPQADSPVNYRAVRFRREAEARWAVFMDSMGVDYLYQPRIRDGGKVIIPAFYLALSDTFLVVADNSEDQRQANIVERLVLTTRKTVNVISCSPRIPLQDGDPFHAPNAAVSVGLCPGEDETKEDVGEDEPYLWCECPHCGRCELQFDGRADRIKCSCPKSPHGDKGYNHDSQRLIAAYRRAVNYRFGPHG